MGINYFTYSVVFIVLIIEVIACYYLFKNWKLRRLISSCKTTRISDLSNGFYKIKGQVIRLSEPLVSPYGEKACVYYDFLVEESKNNGKTIRWEELINDKKMQKFGVHDGSGIAVVDLEYATVELKSEKEFEPVEILNMSYANRERVLKSYDVKRINGNYDRTVRYREHILEEGVQVQVLGTVHGKEDGYPIFKVQGNPLRVTDLSEVELLELYTNKVVYSIVVMISIPLGLLLFWFIETY